MAASLFGVFPSHVSYFFPRNSSFFSLSLMFYVLRGPWPQREHSLEAVLGSILTLESGGGSHPFISEDVCYFSDLSGILGKFWELWRARECLFLSFSIFHSSKYTISDCLSADLWPLLLIGPFRWNWQVTGVILSPFQNGFLSHYYFIFCLGKHTCFKFWFLFCCPYWGCAGWFYFMYTLNYLILPSKQNICADFIDPEVFFFPDHPLCLFNFISPPLQT